MSQLFSPAANSIAKGSIAALVLLLAAISWGAWEVDNAPYTDKQKIIYDQPVPFSHRHHAGELGIDCRYCHTSVTESAFAGIPPTKTCMTCHSQIWVNSPMLAAVRESWSSDQPIVWNRVHNLPRYVYFNHSIHVAKGVGCSTCHGRVDQMPLMYQENTLQMRWCLHCHSAPQHYLRPRSEIFNMAYQPPANQDDLGTKLQKEYEVRPVTELINCSTCHR